MDNLWDETYYETHPCLDCRKPIKVPTALPLYEYRCPICQGKFAIYPGSSKTFPVGDSWFFWDAKTQGISLGVEL